MPTNLDEILAPKSIAVIGASRDPASVGQGVLKSLVLGCFMESGFCKPFKGKVFPVNPKADEILGLKCYPSIKSIPEDVDLAVVCVPAPIVSAVAKECVEKKVKGIVVISAGFAELGAEGKARQDELLKTCRDAGIRLIGPNCLGFLRPPAEVNASFALSSPPAGGVAFITQSGAIADSVIDWAIRERYAFSAIISVGNAADLGIADFVEWAARDSATKVITLYVEGVSDGRRLMQAIRSASRTKPVVILKAGRTASGLEAVASHTGSMAGSFQVFSAAMKQAGAVVADSIEEMFDLAKALAEQPRLKQNAVAIITNGGGAGVLCADYCAQYGLNLVALKPETIAKLDASGKMHAAYSRRNPLDIVGDALADRYKAAVEILLDESYVYGLIVVQTLQTMTQSVADASLLIEAQKKHPEKPIVSVFMGGKFSAEAVSLLESNNVPDFNDPKKAAMAMAVLAGLL
ncbi:CoA-binding protein [Candidatus Micrarchaeota archaeon]|nr:CoA-binding protein [Candidatus Micrarchaeota archaeon]